MKLLCSMATFSALLYSTSALPPADVEDRPAQIHQITDDTIEPPRSIPTLEPMITVVAPPEFVDVDGLPTVSVEKRATQATSIKNETSDPPSMEEFYLKTVVLHGSPKHKDLYLWAAPSGDGASLLGGFSSQKGDWPAYQNGSDVMFKYNDPTPWHLYLAEAGLKKQWVPVSIHGISPRHQGKFWFDKEGSLEFVDTESIIPEEGHPFAGWLVCDWSLGMPQLFYIAKNRGMEKIDTCSKVALVKEMKDS
ncbi:MAG: hypothetical protein MMC23_002652 [Stictis urceolatum]|nr:hypothetical protein [Stictis urceolata]